MLWSTTHHRNFTTQPHIKAPISSLQNSQSPFSHATNNKCTFNFQLLDTLFSLLPPCRRTSQPLRYSSSYAPQRRRRPKRTRSIIISNEHWEISVTLVKWFVRIWSFSREDLTMVSRGPMMPFAFLVLLRKLMTLFGFVILKTLMLLPFLPLLGLSLGTQVESKLFFFFFCLLGVLIRH